MSQSMEPDLEPVRPHRAALAKPGFAGPKRVELLRLIGETGSITQAAMGMGMSYKRAWTTVDVMTQSAVQTLLRRQTGGQHGGGTELTDEGRRLVAGCGAAERKHRRFLALLGRRLKDFDRFYELLT